MCKMKWGKAAAAFVLSLIMLCGAVPEVSYAAVWTGEGLEESVTEAKRGEAIDSAEPDSRKNLCDSMQPGLGETAWSDIDFTRAVDITEDCVKLVNIETPGDYIVFRFVPAKSGTYTFFGRGNRNTSGMLGNDTFYKYSCYREDDEKDERSFTITEYLTAGTAYYCVAQYCELQTGPLLCMVSSTQNDYFYQTEDVSKFEILQPGKSIWYEGEELPESPWDIPTRGMKYRITFKDGNVLEHTITDNWWSWINICGIQVNEVFKYFDSHKNEEGDIDEIVDTERDDNAIIYSLNEEEAFPVEVPVTFHAPSPVASITLDQNPWEGQSVFLSEANDRLNDILEDLEGLVFTVTYTDGSTKTVNIDEGDNSSFIDDGYHEYVKYSWKNYDDVFDEVQAGDNAIVISYMGVTIETPVTVLDNSISSIEILQNPLKMSYDPFSPVDLYGMKLLICFNDGTTTNVTVDEHGNEILIWDGTVYGYLEAYFSEDDEEFIRVWYRDYSSADYYPVFLTYADLLGTAEDILPKSTVSVTINENTKYKVFRFVPSDTEEYEIKSTGGFDTHVSILDANGNELTYDDDGGVKGNFQLKYRLEAGKTYYFLVSMFSRYQNGTFSVMLSGGAVYKITYSLNGGTNNISNPVAYDPYNRVAVPLQNPARPQYTFDGWYTDSAYKNKITQIPAGARQNYTLYAKWTKVKAPGKAKLTSVSNSKAKKIAVKFKKAKDVDGYEIAYSTNKKFKKASSVTTQKTKAAIGKLKKGKTYYVRVCAYNLDSTGQKIRGKWSATKKITVKK